MGRGLAVLIERALGLVDDDDADRAGSTGDVQEQLASREAELDDREERLDVRERALEIEAVQIAAEAKRLATWQARLRSLEHDLETGSRRAAQPVPAAPKVGRNERCPCGSGRKYKQCHGR